MIGATQKGGLWTLTIDRQEKAYSWTRAILAALDAVAVLPVVLKAADGPDSGLQRFGKCTVTWWVNGNDDGTNKYGSTVLFAIWNALKAAGIGMSDPHRGVEIRGGSIG